MMVRFGREENVKNRSLAALNADCFVFPSRPKMAVSSRQDDQVIFLQPLSMRLLTLTIILYLTPGYSLAQTSNDTMVVGHSIFISSQGNENLEVSRKGTLDLQFVEPGKWRATGLRSGFVIIKGSYPATQDTPKTIHHIMVSSESLERDPRQIIYSKGLFPKWACKLPGVKCNEKQISGTLYNEKIFSQLQSECRIENKCINLVQLGEEVEISANIIMQSKNTQNIFSIDTLKAKIQQGRLNFPQLHGEIKMLKSIGTFSILGDPIITMLPNIEAHISTGGEFQSAAQSQIVENNPWKSHGLELKAKFVPISPTRGQIDFNMSLKTQNGNSALRSNKIYSKVYLTQGIPKLVGQIDLEKGNSYEEGQSFLTSIPIIGPLFSANNISQSNQKVLIILTWLRSKNAPLLSSKTNQ